MSNKYIPTTWVGAKTVATADVMNNMEKGISDAHDRLEHLYPYFNNYINALNIGFNNDGVTDNYHLINQFKSGLNIYFPNGTYYFSNYISLAGISNFSIVSDGAVFKFKEGLNTNKPNDNPNRGLFHITNCTNLLFDGFTVDGQNSLVVRGDSTDSVNNDIYLKMRFKQLIGLYAMNSDNIKFKNLKVTHTNAGIIFNGVTDSTIDKCVLYETLSDGVLIQGLSKYVTVSNCVAYKTQDDCYSVCGYSSTTQPHDITITDCVAYECGGHLIAFVGAYNCFATNCFGYLLRQWAFDMYSWKFDDDNIQCKNNVISNCHATIDSILYGNNYSVEGMSRLFYGFSTSKSENNVIKNCTVSKNINDAYNTSTILSVSNFKNCTLDNCEFSGFKLLIHDGEGFSINNGKYTFVGKIEGRPVSSTLSNISIIGSELNFTNDRGYYGLSVKTYLRFTKVNNITILSTNISSLESGVTEFYKLYCDTNDMANKEFKGLVTDITDSLFIPVMKKSIIKGIVIDNMLLNGETQTPANAYVDGTLVYQNGKQQMQIIKNSTFVPVF